MANIGAAILYLSHDSLPPRAPLWSSSIAITWTGSVGGDQEIPLFGAGTYNIDLAMMPAAGLQGLRVGVGPLDPLGNAATAPVKVIFTGGFLWLPPGGSFELAAPAITSNGITSLALVYTANAVVTVSALG